MRSQSTVITLIGIMLAGALTYAQAQWVNYPDSRIPRTKDGKPNLTAPTPRLNRKPDVSGLWQAETPPERDHSASLGKEVAARRAVICYITRNVFRGFWGMS